MYAFALKPFCQTTRDFHGPVTAFNTSGLSRIESRISLIFAGRSPFSSCCSLAIATSLAFFAKNFCGFRHALKFLVSDIRCVHAALGECAEAAIGIEKNLVGVVELEQPSHA